MSTPVFPYRGIEQHGVKPTAVPNIDPDEADYGSTRGVPIEPEEKEPDPIPVRIVDSGSGRERKAFRVYREVLRPADQPKRIVGQDDARSSVMIQNLSVDPAWISDQQFPAFAGSSPWAYQLPANTTLTLEVQTAIWAGQKSDAGADIQLAILVVYSVPL